MKTQTREAQETLTPPKGLELLKKGNSRFQTNLKANRNLLEQVTITATGQYPFATILSCIDSRMSAELIFDQGIGDVFSIRIAGNVLNDDVLGSMEFACKLAGSKLIVVMGHSSCGAVTGACKGAKLGNLTGLLKKIEPAIEVVRGQSSALPTDELPTDEFIQQVADENVDHVVRQIRERSEVLETMITRGEVGIVAAMYSVQSGGVQFHELVC